MFFFLFFFAIVVVVVAVVVVVVVVVVVGVGSLACDGSYRVFPLKLAVVASVPSFLPSFFFFCRFCFLVAER